MAIRTVSATWNGTLKEGNGKMRITGYEGPFTFASRFESGDGTNPEELVGAAHAGCFSMFLAALISGEGLNPESVDTSASVHLGKDDVGPKVTNIDLVCKVKCDGLTQEKFAELSSAAKEKCPISRLLTGAEISLDAKLL